MAGSIRQRGTDSWELRVHAGRDDATGKKLYVTRTVRGGRRAAERALAKLVTEVEHGTVTVAGGTVEQLCEKWFASSSPNWSPTVAAEYRRLLDRQILPRWGTTPLRRLRTSDLDAWYAQLRRSGGVRGRSLAPNSVNRIHAVLRRALNQGVKWGWIAVNPAGAASPPKVRRSSIAIPEPAVIGALVEAAAAVNPGLPVFVRLAAVTGARRGELCGLRWRNVDLDRGVLHIAGALAQVGNEVFEKGTKTHAERTLTLDTRTVEVLAEHRTAFASVVALAGAGVAEDAFVFSHDPDGATPWRPNYVTLAFGRLVKEQGLEGLRLHDLRHFAATTMLTSGIDVRTTAGRLGHAQASTTLDVYAHFVQPADERASAALADALDGPAAARPTRRKRMT